MITHLYVAQFVITYWHDRDESLTSTPSDTYRMAISLSEKFVRRHSNKDLISIRRGSRISEVLAYYRAHNAIIINLANFITPDKQDVNFNDLGRFITDISNRIRSNGGVSYPFVRIYILGHGLYSRPDAICFKPNGRGVVPYEWISIKLFAQVAKAILMHRVFGLYRDYETSGIMDSPLHCTISLVACFSSSGVNPINATRQEIEFHFKSSLAAAVARTLNQKHIFIDPVRRPDLPNCPIPFKVFGRIFIVSIYHNDEMTGRKAQEPRRAPPGGPSFIGETGASSIPNLIYHDPIYKIAHFFTKDARGNDVYTTAPSEYAIPMFVQDLQFARVYRLLVKLQEALSESTKPRLFQEVIYNVVQMLDGDRMNTNPFSGKPFPHLSDNFCRYVADYLREFMARNRAEIDRQFALKRIFGMETRTKINFDRIVREF